MAERSDKHVAGIAVLINGSEISPEMRDLLVEAKVKENLAMPASAFLRFVDSEATLVDNDLFSIGNEVEIKAGAQGEPSITSIFKGQIVSLEPEFGKTTSSLAVRAYDKTHKLQRSSKVRTFQKSTASDIIKKVLGESGLSTGKVADTTVQYEFFQQSGETDRELIRRFEQVYNSQFFMRDGIPIFRPADAPGGPVATLTYQQELMVFRPRISGVQQVESAEVRGWDVLQKRAIVATGTNKGTISKPGLQRSKVKQDSGNGKVLVADRTVESMAEAQKLADAQINGRAEAYVEAEGTTLGNPKLRAGEKVRIAGVGKKLSGDYALTSVTHWHRAEKGYYTHFEISGRSPRGLLDLVHPPEKRDWASHLVVGIVTNANDPQKMGRVKVKYPSLSDQDESAWARIVTLGAGNSKGAVMLPEADDEVVVAFENGDVRRPLVIGALFNGKGKPTDELLQKGDSGGEFSEGGVPDGSFALVTKNRALVHTKKDLTFKSDKKMIVEVTGDRQEKTQGKVTSEGSQTVELKSGTTYTIQAGSSLTLKGVSITVEASGSLKLKGATVDIESSGPATFKGATVNVQGSAATNIKGGIVNLG